MSKGIRFLDHKSHDANVPGQSNEPLDKCEVMLLTPKKSLPEKVAV
jgi:hypothetical protein